MEAPKSSRWQMTVYEGQYGLLQAMPFEVADWGWQDEICPETQKKHRQGYIRTKNQVRLSGVRKFLPGVHVEIARNWAALLAYCKKAETRDPNGQQVHQTNDIPSKYKYAEELTKTLITKYEGTFKTWTLDERLNMVKITALEDLVLGRRGIEWIISDPGWKTMWKDCGAACLLREYNSRQTDRQTESVDECPLDETLSMSEYNASPPHPQGPPACDS